MFLAHSGIAGPVGFCGSAPAGRHLQRFYVAPRELASYFLAKAINIPRRWRLLDTQPTKSGGVSKIDHKPGSSSMKYRFAQLYSDDGYQLFKLFDQSMIAGMAFRFWCKTEYRHRAFFI
jgi:hypothetical protein